MANTAKISGQLKQLNEIRGPVPQALRDYVAAQNRTQKAILNALKDGPKTVPEISAAAGLETRQTLWHLTGLRKYNKIEDVPGRAIYPKYALKNGEAKS